MYITNWGRLMGQSISHFMWLRGHARFSWTWSQMISLCSPQPAALGTASDSAPYCFNFERANQEMTCHFNRRLLPTHSASTPKPFPLSALSVLEGRRTTRLLSSVFSFMTWFLTRLCSETFYWSSCNDRHEELEQWVLPHRGDGVLPP